MENGTYLGATLRKPQCGECDREMEKAHRVHLGTGYCSNCYPRIFPARTCEICGGTARSHRAETNPVCRRCRLADQSCLRCGKVTPKGALRVGDRVACASCARYYQPAQPCDRCSKLSQRLTRIGGHEDLGRVCEGCVRALKCATCAQCGKHRTVFLVLLDRNPVCKPCSSSLGATHACPDCGISVGGVGNARCLSCGIKRSNWVKAQAAADLMVDSKAQSLALGFVGWGNQNGRESMVAAGFARYAEALMRIDNEVAGLAVAIDNSLLLKVFTTEQIRSMGLLAQYFGETGLLTADGQARAEASLERLIKRQLKGVEGKPWAEDVLRFYKSLQVRDKPLSLRTFKSYLNVAIQLLEHSKVSRAEQLSTEAVKKYLRKSPGSAASSTAFLGFLRDARIATIELEASTKASGPNLKQRAKAVRRLQDRLKKVQDRRSRLPLIAKLLAILFGATLENVLRMRMEQLAVLRKGARVHLNENWIDVPAEIAGLIGELAAGRGDQAPAGDSWVFPGRMASDHMSAAAVKYHLEKMNG